MSVVKVQCLVGKSQAATNSCCSFLCGTNWCLSPAVWGCEPCSSVLQRTLLACWWVIAWLCPQPPAQILWSVCSSCPVPQLILLGLENSWVSGERGFPWCWNHYLGAVCSGDSCRTNSLRMGTARNIDLLQLGAHLDNPDQPHHSGHFSPSHLSPWFREEWNKIPWN